jgi:hypothetical protein
LAKIGYGIENLYLCERENSMKNIKKAFGIFCVLIIIAGLLAGCTSDGNANEEQYSYYPVFDKIEKIEVGSAYEPENQIIFMLSDEERSELWQFMRIDEWVIAPDLPLDLSVSPSEFSIHEKGITEEHGAPQSWAFRKWDEQTLISPSLPDKDSKKICYFAPADILPKFISFTETLTPFSGE